jgi:hypothetical protein
MVSIATVMTAAVAKVAVARRAADATRNHLAAIRDERPQHLRVLVIDLLEDLVGEELAARRATATFATAAVITVAIETIVTHCVHAS